MGAFSGMVTGSIVWFINFGHGIGPATASFFKQFVFNLFMAGFNMRSCERIAKKYKAVFLSILSATFFPSTIAFGVLFSIHYYGKTPNIWGTTLWQGIANIFIFLFMALTYRGIIVLENPLIFKFVRVFQLPVFLIRKTAQGIIPGRKQAS